MIELLQWRRALQGIVRCRRKSRLWSWSLCTRAGILSALLIALPCLFCSCRKGSQAPELPSSRSEVVLDLFRNLEKKDHELALKKIEKLRLIDPSSVFLAELEIVERNNMIISGAQKSLDSGNLDKSRSEVENAMRDFGQDAALLAARNEITDATKISKAVDMLLKKDIDSTIMSRSAKEIIEVADKNPAAADFRLFSGEKLKESEKLANWEDRRALEDLVSECIVGRNASPLFRSTLISSAKLAAKDEHLSPRSDIEAIFDGNP